MPSESLQSIAQKMRHLDIAIFTTVTQGGALAGRPMSNNGDVEYDGNSYYFTYEDTRLVSDITSNPKVELGFSGEDYLYVSVAGKAELIRDKSTFKAHWVDELERWFENGVDTPGMVMICVKAERVKYWKGEENGEWLA